MKLQRLDQMSKPPIVGREYLVPVVLYSAYGHRGYWPVLGRLHDDVEHLNFPDLHYHVDIRFCGPTLRRALRSYHSNRLEDWQSLEYVVARTPLMSRYNDKPPRHPQLRRMVCVQSGNRYPLTDAKDSENFRALWKAFAGQQCPSNKHGFVCPHRQMPLGTIRPIKGVITCPLHGLRINAKTGIVMGSPK